MAGPGGLWVQERLECGQMPLKPSRQSKLRLLSIVNLASDDLQVSERGDLKTKQESSGMSGQNRLISY